MKSLLLFLALSFSVVVGIEWKVLDDALAVAKKDKSPVLFLLSKSTCKPCKKLLEELETSTEFSELSKEFALAKAEDDLPKSDKFDLDGKYVPKIIFLNKDGVVLNKVVNVNAKSEKAKYFYRKAGHVVKSMNKALETGDLDHGFGKDYVWYDWEGGLKAAKEQEKPILVVFHQDWCGACQRLKPKFAESSEIKELTSNFVMINTDLEEIVKGDKYKADGEYYPKVLFLDNEGEHYHHEWNHGTKHAHVLHYYGEGKEISESMKRIIANRTLADKIEDNGFGKHIKWVKYEEALKITKEGTKPMMVIIHKTYCGACKALKPRIRNDKEIAELSSNFVMVNCPDDEEPTDDQFDQDGAYIPRIFFLDNLGKVDTSIHNTAKDYEKAKYAYGTAVSIVGSMKKALEKNLGQQKPAEAMQVTASTEYTTNHGFGSQIYWYPYVNGLQEAKKSHKAVMLVFYNDYCHFSGFMKAQFSESSDIAELSKTFIMVKVGEEEGKSLGSKFDIDGAYTPRIFFMDPDQNIHSEVNNTDSQYTNTMFYYGTSQDIVKGMNLALEKINLTLGRGFGEYIQWVKYEKALEWAKGYDRPIMLIIHKTWCGACAALKPIIANSRPIWQLSYHFIMVNVEDEEEPLDNQYFIDGGYYPRIYFLDSQGKVHHDLHNRNPSFLKYKYSYAMEEQVLHSMKFAVAKLVKTTDTSSHTTTATDSSASTQATELNTNDTSKLTPGKKILAASGARFVPIDDALSEAKLSLKPIMFIIHRTTCPACKAVLKMISRAEDFKEKTAEFILSDIEDDVDEDKADSYDVDGRYVPRIYFLDPEGKILDDVWNLGTNYLDNKFYYYETISLYRAMEKTLKIMETWKPTAQQTETKSEEKNETKEKKDEL